MTKTSAQQCNRCMKIEWILIIAVTTKQINLAGKLSCVNQPPVTWDRISEQYVIYKGLEMFSGTQQNLSRIMVPEQNFDNMNFVISLILCPWPWHGLVKNEH